MKSKLFWAIEYIMPTTLGVSNFVVTSSWVYHLTRMSDYLGFGEPWISGNVNLLQGKVDLKFRIEGAKGECTVCFLSRSLAHQNVCLPYRRESYRILYVYPTVREL